MWLERGDEDKDEDEGGLEVVAGKEKVLKRNPLISGDVELGDVCPARWWLALGLNPLEWGGKGRGHGRGRSPGQSTGVAQPQGCSWSVPSPKGLSKPRDKKAQSQDSSVGLCLTLRQDPSHGVPIRALLDQV